MHSVYRLRLLYLAAPGTAHVTKDSNPVAAYCQAGAAPASGVRAAAPARGPGAEAAHHQDGAGSAAQGKANIIQLAPRGSSIMLDELCCAGSWGS